MITRFLTIGCGRIAYRHAIQIQRIDVHSGVCDPEPLALTNFIQKYPVPVYTTIILALENGLHVLCEKPVLLNPDDAESVRQAIKRSGKRLFSVLSARLHPAILQLRTAIGAGTYGKILSFSLNAFWNRPAEYYRQSAWKGSAGIDGGVLYTQFSHYIDAMCWCLGKMTPLAVKTANYLHKDTIEQEDTGVAILRTQQGVLGNLHWSVNCFQQNLEISLTILAENATIKIGGEYMEMIEYEYSAESNSGWTSQFSAPKQLGDHSHHTIIYDELVKALRGESHNLPDLEEAMDSIRLISEIYRFPASQD